MAGGDLREALWSRRSPVGVRRLLSLIKGLSPRATLWRKLRGDQDWGTTEELLAVIAELTDGTNRQIYAAARGPKDRPVWKPLVIPRPKSPVKRRPASSEEMATFFRRTAEDPEAPTGRIYWEKGN